ncbi:unnamed protein product, partial [Laminaria digitata]
LIVGRKYGRRRELPGGVPLQLLQELQGIISLGPGFSIQSARQPNLAFVRNRTRTACLILCVFLPTSFPLKPFDSVALGRATVASASYLALLGRIRHFWGSFLSRCVTSPGSIYSANSTINTTLSPVERTSIKPNYCCPSCAIK